MTLRPSSFIRLVGLPVVCLAMFSVAGGHWAVLQTVAWTQMVWNYSQSEGSIVAGFQKTFGGKAPCSMCRKIETASRSEQKAPATLKADKKGEVFLEAFTSPAPPPFTRFSYPSPAALVLSGRADAPPVPVPIPAFS